MKWFHQVKYHVKNVTVLLSPSFIFSHCVSFKSLISTEYCFHPLASVCAGSQTRRWRCCQPPHFVHLGTGTWYQPDPKAVVSKEVLTFLKSLYDCPPALQQINITPVFVMFVLATDIIMTKTRGAHTICRVNTGFMISISFCSLHLGK